MGYIPELKVAMLQTAPVVGAVHALPLSYVQVYGNNHSITSQLWSIPSGEKDLGKNEQASSRNELNRKFFTELEARREVGPLET
ncbi:hypothetical protein M413DRAFT_30532 [Hebeloma cylindrosporum]|uniref:Uncharacterized protein n=1 Tax=Hebeloma cylindrosporum TaxID=76867 RepID=A0A0C2YA15_HEBCY|nr:hypothetical protein M413DRAFT_30532 [Hebeloma cylindrosporum h7]